MYYLYVAIFGAFGAVTRYWISSSLDSGLFPFSTLLINIAGCFFMAVVVKYLTEITSLSKHFVNGIGTGFIGSFTTFSTFSIEVVQMVGRGDIFQASCYIFVSIAGGFLSAIFGLYISNRAIRRKELKENGD